MLSQVSKEQTHEVTFDQLFVSPEQYHGKQITMEGFYFQGFEIVLPSERLEISGYVKGNIVPKGKNALD